MAEKPPKGLEEKIKRGRDRLLDEAALRNECFEFYRGNQYVYRSSDGYLVSQSTVTNPDGSGKPRHRYRQVRNLIVDVVAHEVSAASQRTPTYEVVPSTVEDEDISAARLAQKVLTYGYDKWGLRRAVETTVTNAVVGDEGFAWPYWDSNVGPFFEAEGETMGQGEIRIGLFGANEVFWEPGVRFEESKWVAVEQARPPSEVMALEGYNGPKKLTPNARAVSDTRFSRANNPQEAELVLTTDYLERPTAEHPNGRWLTLSHGYIIQPEREYPCKDSEGNILDEPVLHKLSYFTDPDSDRDFGLVRHLLDPQRTVNDTTNKQLIWKDMALNPQVIIKNGQLRQRLTDEPGAVFHLRGNDDPIWRPVPQIPNELQEIKEEARRDIAQVAAQNEIPSQVESGKAIQILVERDATRRGNFLANLAEFYSRLGRHCLYLVQRHYTEERLLVVRGEENDYELIRDFLGASLRGQADVRVYAGSIEPQTRRRWRLKRSGLRRPRLDRPRAGDGRDQLRPRRLADALLREGRSPRPHDYPEDQGRPRTPVPGRAPRLPRRVAPHPHRAGRSDGYADHDGEPAEDGPRLDAPQVRQDPRPQVRLRGLDEDLRVRRPPARYAGGGQSLLLVARRVGAAESRPKSKPNRFSSPSSLGWRTPQLSAVQRRDALHALDGQPQPT